MKRIIVISFCVLSAALLFLAADEGMAETPYGDYCPKCGEYGVCRSFLSEEESREAVEGYFGDKGIAIGKTRARGRFIKMELLKDEKVHDIILIDRKTGRIRSVY